jgi:hypothetical protein
MLALVAIELAPQAIQGNWRAACAGGALAAAAMLGLSAALGVKERFVLWRTAERISSGQRTEGIQ